MATYFEDNTIKSLFIKYFISSNYQPMIRFYNRDSYYFKDFIYLKDKNLVQCISDGNKENAKFKDLGPYLKDKFYPNINTKFTSRYSNYDSQTHYYLGQYLRFIRNVEGLDLMPFYNCFNNNIVSGIEFSNEGIRNTVENPTYEIALIPIKYNTKYYIYTNNIDNLHIDYCFYNNGNIINFLKTVNDSTENVLKDLSKTYPGVSFRNPAIITTKDIVNDNISDISLAKRLTFNEENFYLAVKLPKTHKYSLVILEGDYNLISAYKEKIAYKENINYRNVDGTLNVREYIQNKFEINNNEETSIINNSPSPYKNLSPLSMVGWPIEGKQIAFSDRLIEYLLLSVVSPYDPIVDNILRIQEYSKEFNPKFILQTKGEWDNKLTNYLYEIMKNLNQSPNGKLLFDLNGYADKDTYKVISRGE